MQVVIPKLNVRSGPGLTYKDVGDLHEGDMVEVRRLAGKDVWVQIEPGRWVAYALKDEPLYGSVTTRRARARCGSCETHEQAPSLTAGYCIL